MKNQKLDRDSILLLLISAGLLCLGAWFVVKQGQAEGRAVAGAMASLRLMIYVTGAILFTSGVYLASFFAGLAKRTDDEARFPPANAPKLDWFEDAQGENAHLIAGKLRGAAMGVFVFSLGAVATGLVVALTV